MMKHTSEKSEWIDIFNELIDDLRTRKEGNNNEKKQIIQEPPEQKGFEMVSTDN